MNYLRKIGHLFRRKKIEAEMAEEMRAHLEMQARANRASGMPAREAEDAAQRQFGGMDQIKEVAREQRSGLWLEQLQQDLRYGARALRKAPGFATVAVLSLGFGIGSNSAIFGLIDEVLLKTLPVQKPEELVLFHWGAGPRGFGVPVNGDWETDPKTKLTTCTSFSLRAFEAFAGRNETLASLFAFAPLWQPTLIVDGQAESSSGGQLVSGNYYAGLGVRMFLGRAIRAEDAQAGAAPVAVISHRYWERRFAADANVLGKSIKVNGVAVTIVGVTPREFIGALDVGVAPEISLPLALAPLVDSSFANGRTPGAMWWVRMMGRRAPGVNAAQVRANFEAVFQPLALEDLAATLKRGGASTNENAPEAPQLIVGPGGQGLNVGRHEYTQRLTILIGLAALVLVIACVNLANLLLARGASRRREIAARLALGASRGRLVRQLLTESGLLVLLGGAAGVVFAYWSRPILLAMAPLASDGGDPLVLNPQLDGRVLGFTAAVALLTGILFGLVPALRATKLNLNAEFQGGTRQAGGSRSRLAKTLMITQVALSLVLLVGAGLFLRTLQQLENVDVGFNRERLLLFRISAASAGYNPARSAVLHERIVTQLNAVPGVQGATFSWMPLLSRAGASSPIVVAGRVSSSGRPDTAMANAVGPDFFSTIEIPLLLGRSFTPRDDAAAPKVAVINETMARSYFPNENPIGRRFGRGRGATASDIEIIGVARDAKYTHVKSKTPSTVYVPFAQAPSGEANYAVRTVGDPVAVVAAIRAGIQRIDSNLPLADLRTQDAQVAKLFSTERLLARLSSFFGVLALALVCVGLYGLMSYAVTRRTGEIGIRIALGALPRTVLWMVLRESLALVLVGALVGVGVAAGMTRLVTKLLYGVTPIDPLTFGSVALLLIAAGLLAAWLPARGAAKVDPVVALRAE